MFIVIIRVRIMTKLIELCGCIEVLHEISCDAFFDEFIAFVEARGCILVAVSEKS